MAGVVIDRNTALALVALFGTFSGVATVRGLAPPTGAPVALIPLDATSVPLPPAGASPGEAPPADPNAPAPPADPNAVDPNAVDPSAVDPNADVDPAAQAAEDAAAAVDPAAPPPDGADPVAAPPVVAAPGGVVNVGEPPSPPAPPASATAPGPGEPAKPVAAAVGVGSQVPPKPAEPPKPPPPKSPATPPAGEFSPDLGGLARAMKEKRSTLEMCWTNNKAPNAPTGRVNLKFTVGKMGAGYKVSAVKVDSTWYKSPGFESCAMQAFGNIPFSAPPSGTVELAWPMYFR